MDNLFPSYIENIDFRYIKVDDKYVASLIIKDYPKKVGFMDIIESIPNRFCYDLSIFLQKQDSVKVLKELTYHISSSSAEIHTTNQNQVDIDILNQSNEDAKCLRKEIQINNEEIYHVSIFITFYSRSKDEILQILKTFQSKLYSKQLISIISNFRHLDVYLLNQPFNDQKNKLLKHNYRNMTSKSVANLFPFYSKYVFDPNGVIFGYTVQEHKLFHLDIFHQSYFNANMCILGSSGSREIIFCKTNDIS